MTDQDTQILAFNRGVLDSIGLARIDIERYSFAAALQRNWVPRVLGSMMIRPGLKYIDTMAVSQGLNLVRQMPFIFEEDDTALLEFGVGSYMQVRINDVLLERPTVSSTIANGNFIDADNTSPPTSWSVDDDSGCDSFVLDNDLELRGSGEGFARCYQTISVAGPDLGVEHGIRIGVLQGTAVLRIGSTVGDDDIFSATLDTGDHHISFEPLGDFTIQLSNDKEFNTIVSFCLMESGVVNMGTGWSTEDQVRSVRWDQSGDRIYTAADGLPNLTIERRGDGRSWSIVEFDKTANKGPFKTLNTSAITLRPSAIQGDYDPFGGGTYVTLTAESDGSPVSFFNSQMRGHLFRLQSEGQTVTDSQGSGVEVSTLPIRVTGSDNARLFGITIEGAPAFVATAKLQFSFSETGPWNDTGVEFTTATSTSYLDGQDGQTIFYRLLAEAGDWTSGTMTMTLIFTGGTRQGLCRIRSIVSDSVANISILEPFGSIDAQKDWWRGEWGNTEKWPNSVAVHEGRLFWGGEDRIWGSVSDDFENHDDNTEGDSGPINRTIGSGAIRVINWMLSMARLMMGTSENSANIAAIRLDGNNPLSARSSNFDEPLTPFNFNIKTVNSRGAFVDRTRQRLFELVYDIDIQDFKPVDLSIFTPSFNRVGIKQIAVQMKPDIRIHCVREDGTVGMFVYDRTENVMAWVDIELGGVGNWNVEDVAVLPGTVEDQVYYTVEAFNGVTGEERYLLKWSLEEEAIGGLNNYMADAWLQYDGVPIDTMTGLDHLAGLEVCVWADGAYVGNGTVTQFGTPGELDLGSLTLNGDPSDASQSSNVIVGLQYTAQFQSTKLATLQRIGLMEHKKVNKLGFIAENLHHKGIQYGPDFTNLYDLPEVEGGQVVAGDFVWDEYHEEQFPFGGEWDVDSRICLQGQSPKPATILAAIAEFQSVEKLRRQ
jgi:hypothetical protein